MILSQSPSGEVERGRASYRPDIHVSVPLGVCPAECLGVPWSRCPGDYISTSGGRGQVLRFFKASRCLQGACHGWAELLLSLCRAISLLQIPATSSPCVSQTWDFQHSTLISPQIHTSSQSLGFRIPSAKEHGNPESPLTLALLLLPLMVTEFSGFPLDTSSEGLPPTPPYPAATSVITHFLSWASATASLSPATSKLLQSILCVLLLGWSHSDAKKLSVASHWL